MESGEVSLLLTEFDALRRAAEDRDMTVKFFRRLSYITASLGFVWVAVGCVIYEKNEYFSPTGLDAVRNRNGGFPPSKPDSAGKSLPGLKRFEVMGFVMPDGRILVRIFADAEEGKTSVFRGDRAVITSGEFRHEVKLTWDNVWPRRPFSAPVDNHYYSDLYLPNSMNAVQRFSLELPVHESSPAPIRVDFERQERSHLITVPLQ